MSSLSSTIGLLPSVKRLTSNITVISSKRIYYHKKTLRDIHSHTAFLSLYSIFTIGSVTVPLFFTILKVIVMYLLNHSAQCEQCKNVRDNHQGVEGILHSPYKLYLSQ